MEDWVISCDWGTSNLRVRLVVARENITKDEIRTSEGVAVVYNAWMGQKEIDRLSFFSRILSDKIRQLSDRCGRNLNGIPVIISGMLSSSVGMEELPYAGLPFAVNGEDAVVKVFIGIKELSNEVMLISGVASGDDVMRGEETQLIGLFHLNKKSVLKVNKTVFVFPGTHSKHIYVEKEMITRFQTYMTGEVFSVLSEHSILKSSVKPPLRHPVNKSDLSFFKEGVIRSGELPLLHALFTVRTNQLIRNLTLEQNTAYLSGLLIGNEVKHLLKTSAQQIVICSNESLFELYKAAIGELNREKEIIFISPEQTEKATIRGQIEIYKNIKARDE